VSFDLKRFGDIFEDNNMSDVICPMCHKVNKCHTPDAIRVYCAWCRKPFTVFDASVSDGSSADYYELPPEATQLQDLISHKDMNAQMGEIFRATYRYGQSSHSDQLRDAKKIKFYIDAEIARLTDGTH
jgi:hypothetical protein